MKRHNILLFLGIVALGFAFACTNSKTPEKPNILFIAVDDLRPEINMYGESHIISPNLDRLAQDGVVFNRAYCNVPVCGASRASLMTGIFPTPQRFTTYGARVDEEADEYPTLTETFQQNGYLTTNLGKIFHHLDDGVDGWSEEPYRPDYPNSVHQQELWRDYQSEELSWTKESDLPLGAAGPAWEAAYVDDTLYYDGKTTYLALNKLEELKKSDKPFFFGLGYIRPHLPFNCPRKYWDLYDENDIELAKNHFMPENAPKDANFTFSELRSYTNISNDKTDLIPEEQAYKLRHGYYACVSYIDAQIGMVIDKLKELDMYDNTIIVLWGDHGWSLGEHTHWGKHTCFDNALQVPLFVKAPKHLQGANTEALVSLVDLYPTLCELAGIEKPVHLDGKSFVPVLKDSEAKVNDYIFARWTNGESVKSDKYLYTQYYKNAKSCKEMKSSMLYNHETDPEENVNIVADTESKAVVEKLKSTLEEHMQTRLQ